MEIVRLTKPNAIVVNTADSKNVFKKAWSWLVRSIFTESLYILLSTVLVFFYLYRTNPTERRLVVYRSLIGFVKAFDNRNLIFHVHCLNMV